jgi:hypothetical protein
MTQDTNPRTPQETALIDAHVQRAAELRIQLDLLVLRSMAREIEAEAQS